MRNFVDMCEECDYSIALCDGDVSMCYNAKRNGYDSEKGMEDGDFDRENVNREFFIESGVKK